MSTLEDKILGEKSQYYCSSSEDSDHSDDESPPKGPSPGSSEPPPPSEVNKWEGTSTNTGPKGVIKDWQRYKQLETEKRVQDEQEKIALMKKLTLTVRSSLDEEREKAALDDPELADLLDDEFLITYQKQRMKEMIQNTNLNLKFGDLIMLRSGQEFLEAIDGEHKSATIIVHIYEDIEACRNMNDSLKTLCKIYTNVKFCCIKGSAVGISSQFKADGVPALLVYKGGHLVGNFIRISDELGANFIAEDVQTYLVEHGLLEDKTCTPILVSNANQDDDSD
ncbi:unnamed protein product [Phyllotreta striolata]|uniref:Phosducin domain-containing protein n=1 Tax=Phyllotreta striolata TaxID=444603 RepID=A0A9N9TMF9_PHYSR|nr:unnamed protein product [Phyllotreta striolata]